MATQMSAKDGKSTNKKEREKKKQLLGKEKNKTKKIKSANAYKMEKSSMCFRE